MNTAEFIQEYPAILEEIAQVVQQEYAEALDQLRVIPPEDLLDSLSEFQSRDQALGFVYRQVILRVQTLKQNT